MTDGDDDTMTRRDYLLIAAFRHGADPLMAVEALSSVALAHPEWDMEEQRTYEQWERS